MFSTRAETREGAIQTVADINRRRLGLTKNITVGDIIGRYLQKVIPIKDEHKSNVSGLNGF